MVEMEIHQFGSNYTWMLKIRILSQLGIKCQEMPNSVTFLKLKIEIYILYK